MEWVLLSSLLLCFAAESDAQVNFAWGRQFGTGQDEAALNAATDRSGNVYIAGNTQGNLSGSNYGNSDGFLTKLDSTGNILWTKQFGTKEKDVINWLTVDKTGHIYLAGATGGIVGAKSYGQMDIWVVKFDSSGTIDWQQQYGSDSIDVGNGIFVNEKGEILVSGATKGTVGNSSYGKADCLILKLDARGNKIFALQFGTNEDESCDGITCDGASTVYVCGGTFGDLSGKNKGLTDSFVGIFDTSGKELKIIQYGTNSRDMAHQLVVDKDGTIYAGGSTGGDFAGKQQGEGDAFLVKINKTGEIVWSRQFGTEKWDGILGVDLNESISDNLVVSGCQHWPDCQSFIRAFNKNGDLVWTRNSVAIGKFGGTCGKGVCLDGKGNVYHTGLTGGNLFSPVQGQHDIFVLKYEVEKSSVQP